MRLASLDFRTHRGFSELRAVRPPRAPREGTWLCAFNGKLLMPLPLDLSFWTSAVHRELLFHLLPRDS